jgi:hypothetical protein
MRSIYAIQKDIAAASHKLNNLILEKKLTVAAMRGAEASSQILTEQLMKRLKNDTSPKRNILNN